MSQRVWVVIDLGGGSPYYQTVRQRRDSAILAYDKHVGGLGFDADKRNGYVRCVAATLTIEQPKSTKRKARSGSGR